MRNGALSSLTSHSVPRRSCTWAYVLHHMGHHGTSPCTDVQHSLISYRLWALQSRSREGNRDHWDEWLILTYTDCSQQSWARTEGPGAQPGVPSSMTQLFCSHLLTVRHLLNQVLILWILLAGLGVICEVSRHFLGNESRGAYPTQTLTFYYMGCSG